MADFVFDAPPVVEVLLSAALEAALFEPVVFEVEVFLPAVFAAVDFAAVPFAAPPLEALVFLAFDEAGFFDAVVLVEAADDLAFTVDVFEPDFAPILFAVVLEVVLAFAAPPDFLVPADFLAAAVDFDWAELLPAFDLEAALVCLAFEDVPAFAAEDFEADFDVVFFAFAAVLFVPDFFPPPEEAISLTASAAPLIAPAATSVTTSPTSFLALLKTPEAEFLTEDLPPLAADDFVCFFVVVDFLFSFLAAIVFPLI